MPRESLPQNLADLEALARKAEQEWWWLNGALHAVAQVAAEGPPALAQLRAQAADLDRLRVAISVHRAALERAGPAE